MFGRYQKNLSEVLSLGFRPLRAYNATKQLQRLHRSAAPIMRLYSSGMDTGYVSFDARKYLMERCPGNEFEGSDKRIHTHWSLGKVHNFYEEFHNKWDNSTATVLEFGSGPYIHTLISAAPYVGHIYHTDYLEECRREALMWKNKDHDAYNWTPYFKYIVNTLEGINGNNVVAEREELLRNKLKDSLFVDMRSSNMLPGYLGKFDIIYSGFCIESIAPSLQEYRAIMERVYNLLNPNGFLLMLASQGCTWYTVNGVVYPTYPIHINDVLSTLNELGFTLCYLENVKKIYEDGVTYYNDKKYYGCFVAQKA
ncbi:nicotinamide N-methyltransferase-like [Dysidea avara]|uniref:nicotinamide N-methyltransferase-like n=1 Tax=Dysidea avara TaxID=196820 RepID=UPI00331AD286